MLKLSDETLQAIRQDEQFVATKRRHSRKQAKRRTQPRLPPENTQPHGNTSRFWRNGKSFGTIPDRYGKMSSAILLQYVHDSDTPQTINQTPLGQTLNHKSRVNVRHQILSIIRANSEFVNAPSFCMMKIDSDRNPPRSRAMSGSQ